MKWAGNKYLFLFYYILIFFSFYHFICSQNNYYAPWTNVANWKKLITQNLPYFHQNSLKIFLNLTDCWKKYGNYEFYHLASPGPILPSCNMTWMTEIMWKWSKFLRRPNPSLHEKQVVQRPQPVVCWQDISQIFLTLCRKHAKSC